jgi:drug/metabolite transporter (DMT)-like permease
MLTACIWGFGFVAQRKGMNFVGPFTYNGVRFALGSISLIPLILYLDKKNNRKIIEPGYKKIAIYSIFAGILLFLGASFQQVGLQYTTAGKAGFITGLYVVFVPFIGLLFGRRVDIRVFAGAVFAVVGLYFLSISKEFQTPEGNLLFLFITGKIEYSVLAKYINYGDILELICAVFFASHVVLIGWLSNKADPLKISALQFAICALLSASYAVYTETILIQNIIDAWIPIFYGGFFSVGVAYTLQVVAQKGIDPSKAAIILSFEAVFAVIGGVIILDEHIGIRGLTGCGLMFLGIILSQRVAKS